MTPSIRQQAIYDCWQNDDSNILIQAVAGSGKTSTLLELLTMCRHRTLFLAFNKAIQTEINDTIKERGLHQGKAMTMHSMGLQAIRKHTKFRINNNKNFEIIKDLQDSYKFMFKTLKWEEKVKLSYTLMDMNDTSRIYLTDVVDEIKIHMLSMDKSFFDMEFEGESIIKLMWDEFLVYREARYNKTVMEIDFHDMIFVPVVKDLEIPVHPYYLMVDEAQDLNIVQHALIDKLLSQGTIKRWIAVGDTNQAIYGFSGAYASSFKLFAEKGNVKELPLDICYRCPSDIIDSANEVYDVMEGFKSHTGTVGTIPSFHQIKDASLVICRNTSPLIDLYFRLLGENRKVQLKGEDILGAILKFLKPYKYKSVSDTMRKMSGELRKLENEAHQSDNHRFKAYRFKSNFDDFKLLANNLKGVDNHDTIDVMIKKVTDIFKDEDSNAITLCTIHKSKGLESNVVYILNEHLIPSKFAVSESQLQQEQNLKYVARTRAKEELYFLKI